MSSQPLVKAAVQLLALINSLCAMLRTTPFHRESYSRLILTVIVQFYQRCSDRFQDLATLKSSEELEEPRIALAAQWAQRSEVVACLTELFAVTSDANSGSRHQLCKQECHLEGQLLGERTIGKDELISSTRNLSSLASLYHSVVRTICSLFIPSLTFRYRPGLQKNLASLSLYLRDQHPPPAHRSSSLLVL